MYYAPNYVGTIGTSQMTFLNKFIVMTALLEYFDFYKHNVAKNWPAGQGL